MSGSQKEIIAKLREIMKPLEDHIKNLEELCEDPGRTVARDFLAYYRKEYAQYQDLLIMLMAEFTDVELK